MTDRDPDSPRPSDASPPRAEGASSDLPRDRALIVGEVATASGETKGLAVLRQRGEGGAVEAGIVRPTRDGEPITGELVALKPTHDGSRICDVEVLATRNGAVPTPDAGHKGPARVVSDRFRDGWDAIFGATRDRSSLN